MSSQRTLFSAAKQARLMWTDEEERSAWDEDAIFAVVLTIVIVLAAKISFILSSDTCNQSVVSTGRYLVVAFWSYLHHNGYRGLVN